MTSTNEMGLATERVRCSTEMDLHDIHCSTTCENILWKPVACQQCETHFCSKCIAKWLNKNPNQCPMRCDSYIQRPCSKFIVRQLAKLQIVCIYQSNGSNEIVPYEALEKHELTCGYQHVKCPGCQSEILRKNMTEHRSHCPAITPKFEDITFVCGRNDVLTPHSDIIDLRRQLQNLRRESQHDIQQLREQVRQVQNNQTRALASRGIVVDDAVLKRTYLQSTVEIDALDKQRIIRDNDSHSVLTDALICSECHDVFWKPVCCGTCGTVYCKKCRPQQSILNRISTFFGAQSPQHGPKNCQKFEESSVPHDVATNLGRLRVRCAYAPNGCEMISLYCDLEQHERQCQFEKIPCELCQLYLSKRQPIAQHTLRVCFQEMMRKNPAGIQQQFMKLLNATEKAEADNRRLQSMIDELKTQLNTLNSVCVKKSNANNK